jgi:hypothetical protein
MLQPPSDAATSIACKAGAGPRMAHTDWSALTAPLGPELSLAGGPRAAHPPQPHCTQACAAIRDMQSICNIWQLYLLHQDRHRGRAAGCPCVGRIQ